MKKKEKWLPLVAYREDLKEVQDDKSHLLIVPPKPIMSYPLRSHLKTELDNLGFDGTKMKVPKGKYRHEIALVYVHKLLRWLNEPDNTQNFNMEVDNSTLFNNELLLMKKPRELFERSITITEAVWNLLIESFGGGKRIRFMSTSSNYFKAIRVICSSYHPTYCRTFIFSAQTPVFTAKQEICEVFDVIPAYSRWYDFFREEPYARLDKASSTTLRTRQLLHENLSFVDVMDANGKFAIGYISEIIEGSTRKKEIPVFMASLFTQEPNQDFMQFVINSHEENVYFDSNIHIEVKKSDVKKSEDRSRSLLVAVNNEEGISNSMKTQIFSLLEDIDHLEVRYKMSKSILSVVKDVCSVFIMKEEFIFHDAICCLPRFSSLRKVEICDLVTEFSLLERKILKALESCATLEDYKSSHFLGESLVGEFDPVDYFKFELEPKITERIRFPFNTGCFHSVKFEVRSIVLTNPEERFTRQLYSALLFVDHHKVQIPRRRVLHISPENTMQEMSYYL